MTTPNIDLAQFGNRSLDVSGAEPLVRDVDLGEWLAYGRARDIKPFIKRLIDSGDLPNVHVRGTVSRTSMPRGGERETTVDEYWLTEDEALFVLARSETPVASALLKEMIRVFRLAMRGMLVAPLAARIAELEARASAPQLPTREPTAEEIEAQLNAALRATIFKLVGENRANGSRDDLGFTAAHYTTGTLVTISRRLTAARKIVTSLIKSGDLVEVPSIGGRHRRIMTPARGHAQVDEWERKTFITAKQAAKWRDEHRRPEHPTEAAEPTPDHPRLMSEETTAS